MTDNLVLTLFEDDEGCQSYEEEAGNYDAEGEVLAYSVYELENGSQNKETSADILANGSDFDCLFISEAFDRA